MITQKTTISSRLFPLDCLMIHYSSFLIHRSLQTFFLFLFLINVGYSQVSITFQIDMSYQIEQGKFDPNAEWVEVAGTFNNWNGSGRFLDNDNDQVYELTISNLSVGADISFKFRYNGQWDGREEFPGLGNDRIHQVGSENETLYFWYNNESPPNADLVADFHADVRSFYADGIISFKDRSSGLAEQYKWTFEGGTPMISNEKNPVVQYKEAGKYKVKLEVSKGDNSNEVIVEDYITVLERNTTNIPWWNETVFYEIFVRSFKDSDGDGIGDFNGLTEQLDYLNDGDPTTNDDLGITGIWLMPIHPAGSYHGYDVIDYKAVSEELGGMEDFKKFLAAAHDRGIKVIIDFVMNHNSSQSEWFQNALTGPNATYRNFYSWADNNPNYAGPWGQKVWHEINGDYYYGVFWHGMPDLNYKEPKVKEAMFEAADFWLEEIGIDGFRLDAVKYMVEEGQRQEDTESTYQLWHAFNQHIKATKPNAFSVGEAWTNTETILNYVENDRLDYCFEFDLAGKIMYAANEGVAWELYDQMQKMYTRYPHLQYGTFLANHDQNRIMNSFGNDESKVKLAAAIYLTLPGIPYIYYGEEIGMMGAKPDEDIRRPMQWNDGPNAGFTTGSPWRAPQSAFPNYNVAKEANDPTSLLNSYKQLIQLRNREKALQIGEYTAVPTNESKVFAFLRSYEEDTLLVVHNTSISVLRNLIVDLSNSDLATGNWIFKDLLGNEAPIIKTIGSSQTIDGFLIGGRKTLVYKLNPMTTSLKSEKTAAFKIYPNPARSILTIAMDNPSVQKMTYSIVDIHGRVVGNGAIERRQQITSIPISQLPKGIYYLKLGDTGDFMIKRFAKI